MLKEEKLLFALNDVSARQLEETRERLGYGTKTKARPRRRWGRVLLIAAVISGAFIGLCVQLLLNRLPRGKEEKR